MDVLEDVRFQEQFKNNGLIFKRELDRIIDKYSNLPDQDIVPEVDLEVDDMEKVARYMRDTKKKLDKLESKRLADLTEESLRAQDVTSNSQLDFTLGDGGPVQSFNNRSYVADDGFSIVDSSQLTVSTSSLSEADLQPEDQDEELEMSLRSQGSTLAELYPSTISEIGRAKHQQYISEAAGSVLRRYRRWRCLSNRSNLESTLNITQRHAQKFPKKIKSKHTLEDTSNSPLTRHFRGMSNTGSITARPSPDKAIHLQDWQTQLQSRWRDRRSLRRDQQQPVHVMDLSGRSETSKPERTKQNKTSTVTQLSSPFFSQLGEESFCGSTVSTSHLYSPSAKAFLDLPLRSKRLSLSAHSPQKAGCSMNAYETGFQERPDIYRSPVRQSPLKARMVTRERLSKSPYAFSRRPTSDSVGSYSREPVRSRSQSTFLSSPLHKPTLSQRMLYSQDSRHSPQLPLYSPQPAHHRLRRHLSFDSSLPLRPVSYSEKEIDEEFKRLYHKFVCQNKSFHFNSPPCRLCASSSEARDHSSQTLAALALSPHRFVQKKRHREEDWEIHPESKRSREGYCTYSPGSKRNGKEMLRRRLCPSGLEVSHAGCSHGGGVQQSFRSQQLSADATEHQGRPASAATFSDIGLLERKIPTGNLPSMSRKWW